MLSRFFDRKPEPTPGAAQSALSGPKFPRHSGAWDQLRKQLVAAPGLRVLDVGITSAANINLLTNLGHSVYLADFIQDSISGEWRLDKDSGGAQVWDMEGFANSSLKFAGRNFDIVLLWMALDYLPEPFLVPVVNGLYEAMVPGGKLLCVFNTKMTPDVAPHFRFHVTLTDLVEFQAAQPVRLQRALTNRNIERLFAQWSGLKQFLAKDGVSEAIITR